MCSYCLHHLLYKFSQQVFFYSCFMVSPCFLSACIPSQHFATTAAKVLEKVVVLVTVPVVLVVDEVVEVVLLDVAEVLVEEVLVPDVVVVFSSIL